MDIKEFLEQSTGKWFAQRTHCNLADRKAESNKSDLTAEMLSPDAAEVVGLCRQKGVNPATTLGGFKVSWDTSIDWGKTKQVGSTLLVLIPDRADPRTGTLLRRSGSTPILSGQYNLGDDEALTLTVEGEGFYAEERLWFASPNLRLRMSLTKTTDDFEMAAFYSEIRKIPPKNKES